MQRLTGGFRAAVVVTQSVPLFLLAAVLPGQVMLRPHPLDVANLSIPDATKTLLRSGFDPNDGNYDSGNLIRVEPAGKSFEDPASEWVLFDAQGPGAITSMWFTGKNQKGQPYLGGKINFYFDREAKPAFSGQLPELFESGNIFPAPLAEKSHGGWVNYAPVYFARSLKITISEHNDSYTHRKNGRGETIPHLYHQFSYQRFGAPVKTTLLGAVHYEAWRRDERGDIASRDVDLHPGEPVMLFEAHGQGILNELRLKWDGGDPDEAALRITADGGTTIEMKVSELWGFSRKLRPAAQMQSLLLGVEDDGAYYSWFPMPYRRSLRIEVTDASGRVRVTTRTMRRWPERKHFYFRANRVTDVTEPGRDIRILQAQGGGHFIGAILQVDDKSMEGDDRFHVDGETFPPAWHGTGTEDYFRCGWYFHGGPITRPLYGMLDALKPKIAYRFHIADRVNFTKSVVIGFEHGHRDDYIGSYRGVAFWYSESSRFGALARAQQTRSGSSQRRAPQSVSRCHRAVGTAAAAERTNTVPATACGGTSRNAFLGRK